MKTSSTLIYHTSIQELAVSLSAGILEDTSNLRLIIFFVIYSKYSANLKKKKNIWKIMI